MPQQKNTVATTRKHANAVAKTESMGTKTKHAALQLPERT